jgi:hypothetical protein
VGCQIRGKYHAFAHEYLVFLLQFVEILSFVHQITQAHLLKISKYGSISELSVLVHWRTHTFLSFYCHFPQIKESIVFNVYCVNVKYIYVYVHKLGSMWYFTHAYCMHLSIQLASIYLTTSTLFPDSNKSPFYIHINICSASTYENM